MITCRKTARKPLVNNKNIKTVKKLTINSFQSKWIYIQIIYYNRIIIIIIIKVKYKSKITVQNDIQDYMANIPLY